MAKKKKKQKKQAQQQIHDLTLAQLIHAGEASLRNDTPKAAVDVLRFAVKKHGLTPELKRLLFRAYLSHADQLGRQGQAREAETAAAQVNPLVEDVSWLGESDLLDYISLYPGPEAFEAYTRYVRYHARVPAAENWLASHLFRHRQWALADRLDGTIPLKREVDAVRPAVAQMDAGAWENALEGLGRLPRKSPFSPVRLLCRAMSAFYAENDADAVKALSMIPGHFPLSGVAALLKEILSAPRGTETRRAAASRLPVLWEGPVHLKADAENLVHHLDRRDVRSSIKTMRRMAQSACPENPQPFCTLLLQTAWWAVFTRKLDPDGYLKLASALLPETRARSLHARMMMTVDNPFAYSGIYLTKHLAADFPDAGERSIAHAAVLLYVVRQLHKSGLWEDIEPDEIPDGYRDVLGIDSKGSGGYPVEMTAKALSLDPSNRDGYLLLTDLPRPSRDDRKTVETVLLAMLDEFPDDPFPCLELASVYYENHAFRKAENILKDAMRRAPHDNRVVDKHAVSLLIASEKNIRRGKFHLAAPDVERAGALASRGAAPYIAAKRTLLALINPLTPQATLKTDSAQLSLFDDEINFSACLDREMSALPLLERLRMLAFLLPDLEDEDFSQKKSILKLLTERLKENLKQAKALSSTDIVRLLSPLEKDYAPVFRSLNPAPFLLKHEKNLLGLIKDDDITAAYDLIMAPDTFAPIQKDIRKRLKHAGGREKVILGFYLAAVRHLSGESSSYDLFHDVLDQAPEGAVREELRSIARRLSRHAAGHLRDALSHFYFGPAPGDSPFLPPDDDDDDAFPFFDDDDEDWEDGYPGPGTLPSLGPGIISILLDDVATDPAQFVDRIEAWIDDMDLRGASERTIKEARGMLSTVPDIKELFDQLARRLDPALPEIAGMSREAHVFLYGGRRDKKTRKRR